MKQDQVVFVLVLILAALCGARDLKKRSETPPIIRKIDAITKQLEELTDAMEELDVNFREALSVDLHGSMVKRQTSSGDTSWCTGFRDDICQALEIQKQLAGMTGWLTSYSSPGKRSGINSTSARYQKLLADLHKKRALIKTLTHVFSNAGDLMKREKKWFTCNLNLGFTCQAQEYSAIADYYDFLNSPESPGKKRSFASQGDS